MTGTASPAFIRDASSGLLVPAELHDYISEKNLLDWHGHWRPEVSRRLGSLVAQGVPQSQWPESWHWEWPAKLQQVQDLLAYKSACITCQGMTQGMMSIKVAGHRGRLPTSNGKDIAYVDYLEVAPWNWVDSRFPSPRYGQIGTVLVAAAIQISQAESLKGSVGLHSLPQSIGFYERCGFKNLGPDSMYKGNLSYLEITSEEAEAFLKRGSRK